MESMTANPEEFAYVQLLPHHAPTVGKSMPHQLIMAKKLNLRRHDSTA